MYHTCRKMYKKQIKHVAKTNKSVAKYTKHVHICEYLYTYNIQKYITSKYIYIYIYTYIFAEYINIYMVDKHI